MSSVELEEKSVPLRDKNQQITENTSEIKQTVEPSKTKESSAIIPETLGQQLATKKPISALSLAGLRAKKELEAKQSQHLKHLGELPSENFTETDMLLLWNKFAQRMSDTGKMLLSTYMLMNEPILEGTTITLELPNESTKEEFLSGCVELIGYLRGKLHNHDIVINVKVNETVEKKYAFTPDDKYERLRNINPAIDLLRKTFDLDV